MAKGGTELFQDSIAQELLASKIPARLAYTWTDGTPRVVSLWFHWDGHELVMCTVDGVPDEYARAAARYLGSQIADGYIQSLPATMPMARIAVRPDEVVILDF